MVKRGQEVHGLCIGRSDSELRRKLRTAQIIHEHGEQVCSANRTPGADTLKPGLDLVGKI